MTINEKYSLVNCVGLFKADGGKDHYFLQKYLRR